MVGLIIVVVFLSYIGIASLLLYLLKGVRKKLVALVIFLLIPTADVMVGRVYFAYLCNTQSGQFIYKTVAVGEEDLYKPGEINKYQRGDGPGGYAFAKGGEINQERLRERYDFPFGKTMPISSLFHIYKHTRTITDKASQETLGKSVSFLYGGGWVFNIYPLGEPGYCEENQMPSSKQNIHARLFDKTFY